MKREAVWHDFLIQDFPDGVTALETPFDIPQFQVEPDHLVAVAAAIKEQGFDMLLDLGAVDYLPRSPRFEVVYHFLRMRDGRRLRLRCSPLDTDPQLPSLSELWPTADPAEREVYDLFGVRFTGHPNLTRIMMPPDWEGYPLRKDYPLKGDREHIEAPYAADKNRYHAPKLSKEGS